jgi:YD repeat-containing protein
VNYTYDADSRRGTMTVAGQTAVSYAYDNAHRLTSITQGTSVVSLVVSLTYDDANRRSTLTYPNGIVATYGYDNANHLTGLTYTLGQTTVGNLTYTYDAAGNRSSVGGSWARTGIPAALTSATYDAANRATTWGTTSLSYDSNGNLTGDGATTYSWNARNQLTGLSGGISATFVYDGLGRRRGKIVSGTTTNLLYDGLNLVQEQTSSGTSTANLPDRSRNRRDVDAHRRRWHQHDPRGCSWQHDRTGGRVRGRRKHTTRLSRLGRPQYRVPTTTLPQSTQDAKRTCQGFTIIALDTTAQPIVASCRKIRSVSSTGLIYMGM